MIVCSRITKSYKISVLWQICDVRSDVVFVVSTVLVNHTKILSGEKGISLQNVET